MSTEPGTSPTIGQTEAQLAAIGRITVGWTTAEHFAASALAIVLGNARHADVIMSTAKGFDLKANLLMNLVRECLPEKDLAPDLINAVQKLKDLYPKRNDLVHGLYSNRVTDNALFVNLRKPHRKTNTFEMREVSAA